MGKLIKRDSRGSAKKCGGKVRGYIAEGADDRFCICIHAGAGPGETFEYVLRLSDDEVKKLIPQMTEYLSLGEK